MNLRVAFGWLCCSMGPLLGCKQVARPVVTVPDQGSGQITIRPPALDATITEEGERRDTQALIDATFAVLRSQAFQSGVMAAAIFPDGLWLSAHGETIPAREALAAYLGLDPRFTNVVSTVQWTTGNETGPMPGKTTEALIQLGPAVLAQWRAPCALRRSCAINSMAHELTHTIPQKQGAYDYLFTDDDRSWATREHRALVSYTFGSVAQCVYLQQAGALDGSNLEECVRRWGTNQFYSHDCD